MLRNKRVVFCIVALVTYALYSRFSAHYSVQIETTYAMSAAARDNQFYIAEKFLNAHRRQQAQQPLPQPFAISHVSPDYESLLNDLPNPVTHPVIVWGNQRNRLSAEQVKRLLQWVEQGGHLITTGAPKLSLKQWKSLDGRLLVLRKKQATPAQISQDTEITEIFNKVRKDDKYSYKNNPILESLGIFLVRGDEERDLTKDSQTPFALALKEASTRVTARLSKAVNDYDRNYGDSTLRRLYNAPSSVFLADGEKTFLLHSLASVKNRFQPELLLATKHATLRNTYQSASATQIKQILRKDAQMIAERIAQTRLPNHQASYSDRHRVGGHYNYFFHDLSELHRIKMALDTLLAMPNAEVPQVFLSNDNVLSDLNYGAGRLTVMNDVNFLGNPYLDLGIMLSQTAKDSGVPYETLHRVASMKKLWESNYRGHHFKKLYHADSTAFLLHLTQGAPSVWFVTTPYKKHQSWLSFDWLKRNPTPMIAPRNETPNALLYRVLNAPDYATRKTVSRKKRIRHSIQTPNSFKRIL